MSITEMKLDTDSLQIAWNSRHNQNVRSYLISHYSHLVRKTAAYFAARIPNNHIEFEDLISAGCIGLIDAVDRYNPMRANKFETYAIALIRGAIYNYLRQDDWISRSVREIQKKIAKVNDAFRATNLRDPEPEEVAAILGISLKKAQEYLRLAASAHLTYLEDECRSNEPRYEPELEACPSSKVLDYLDLLDAEKKIAIYYTFFEKKSYSWTARELKITVDEVQTLVNDGISDLRDMFGGL